MSQKLGGGAIESSKGICRVSVVVIVEASIVARFVAMVEVMIGDLYLGESQGCTTR